MDPRAGSSTDAPDVIVESTGTKRRAETAIEEIDPRAGDRTDASTIRAAGVGKTKESTQSRLLGIDEASRTPR